MLFFRKTDRIMERWQSGRMHTIRNRANMMSVPRVQIPISPPKGTKTNFVLVPFIFSLFTFHCDLGGTWEIIAFLHSLPGKMTPSSGAESVTIISQNTFVSRLVSRQAHAPVPNGGLCSQIA